jgi:methylated-DNA-[protein]-cysteine S-methyltransferase
MERAEGCANERGAAVIGYRYYDSPLGRMLVVASREALQGVHFIDEKYYPGVRAEWADDHSHPIINATIQQLSEYFLGDRQRFDLPLEPSGTEFQKKVWRALLTIPYGQTRSYGRIAKQISNRLAMRAVGAAAGRNPISIIVPCHRVIGVDGSLTGYAGGIGRKQALLALEERFANFELQPS